MFKDELRYQLSYIHSRAEQVNKFSLLIKIFKVGAYALDITEELVPWFIVIRTDNQEVKLIFNLILRAVFTHPFFHRRNGSGITTTFYCKRVSTDSKSGKCLSMHFISYFKVVFTPEGIFHISIGAHFTFLSNSFQPMRIIL